MRTSSKRTRVIVINITITRNGFKERNFKKEEELLETALNINQLVLQNKE